MKFHKHTAPIADIYQTGRTAPPKSRRGLIAFLLALIILLCGIITWLSFMNVQLFRLLAIKNEAPSLVFQPTAQVCDTENAPFGLCLQELSSVWRTYYHLPEGIYISAVKNDSIAQNCGITQGDILVSIADQNISDIASLTAYLETHSNQPSFSVRIYRDGTYLNLTLANLT